MVLLLVFSFPLTFSGLLQCARASRCQWFCGNIFWRKKMGAARLPLSNPKGSKIRSRGSSPELVEGRYPRFVCCE